jgi:hypothetical protein
MSVDTVVYMIIALFSLTSSLKMSKKYQNQAQIDKDLAFTVYFAISALLLLVPYATLRIFLSPGCAVISALAISITIAKIRRQNV